jgi:hypothetical protein
MQCYMKQQQHFYGTVYFHGEVNGIHTPTPIKCDACQQTQLGFQWDDDCQEKTICFSCIRDMAIHHQAQQSWMDQNGDPLQDLRNRIEDLEKLVKEKCTL